MALFARHGSATLRVCCTGAAILTAGKCLRADPPADPLQKSAPAALLLDAADGASDVPPETAPPHPFTGDWWGYRRTLDQRGISFAGSVLLDASRNLTGGLTQDQTALRYLLELSTTLDMEKLWGIHGGTLFADFENHDGPNGSLKLTGDLQGFDGIDAGHFTQIDQLWYQQRFAGDAWRIKLGKIDANTDFSLIEHAREFLNSSMSYSLTIFPMVTYPDPAPGGEIFWDPGQIVYAGAGAFYSNRHQTFLDFAGHPSAIEREAGGAFLIAEAGARWKLPGDLPGHAGAGGWGDTGNYADFRGGHSRGAGGAYLFADQSLFHDEIPQGAARDLGIYFQCGLSNASISPFARHIGGGFAATGLVPGRPADIFGVGPTWVKLGDFPKGYSDEFAIEAFYRLQLTSWLNFKPDLQYIRHPAGKAIGDALVFTLRAEVDF